VSFARFCSIHAESDEYPWHSARLWDQGDIINLGYMCDEVHRHQSLAGVQLWYNGMQLTLPRVARGARGPAACRPNVLSGARALRRDADEATSSDHQHVRARGRSAPSRRVGFVEVTGSTARCRCSFSSAVITGRTDRYGGSLANRSAFLHRVMRR